MGTRVFSLVASLVLISACSGEIGDAPAAARSGPTSDLSDADNAAVPNGPTGAQDPFPHDDPTCPSAAAVVSVSNGWRSTEASQPAFDTLQLSFLARPEAANIDALVGVGSQDIDDFSNAMLTVRFADDGLIDVRDGSVYDSDVAFTYEPDVWYAITISADITSQTYDVEVARCGESPQMLITGAAFRSEAGASDRLTTWAAWSSQNVKLDVSTPSWVASGNCAPATCQSLGLECGQLSDGCGGILDCGGCPNGQTCATGGLCVDVPPPPPPPPPGESRGRGPSGQWPTSQGFPAYGTSAELTTNGTMSGLRSAIENAACSDGCVIEHAGAISGNISSRAAGTGRIVIRPPIGERAEHAVDAEIRVDNLLIAGYGGGAANIGARECVNCGYAWIESRAANGHGSFSASCGVGASERLESIWYEIVFANYADWNQEYDRGGMYGVPNEVSDCRMLIRGWYLAGVTCPDNKPPGINCHSDSIQEVLWPGSTCVFEIHDSIFWPSEDKVMQTSSWDSPCNSPADVYNSTFISPPYAETLWTGDPISYDGRTPGWYPPGPQPFHTTANVHFRDSTLIGGCYPQPGGFDIRVDDSELYDAYDCPQDSASSGNTTLSSLPSVPGAPTHVQLDAIWSP